MTANGIFQLVLYLVVLLALAKPLGGYMARVYEGQPCRAGPRPRLARAARSTAWPASGPRDEMGWKTYAVAMLLFNLAGLLVVYLLQRLQGVLPLNPQGWRAVTPDSSFNTAVSFATNTNWQGYGGETTMSYLTQMLGLTVQNFVSAATGMAVLVALIRGFARTLRGDDRQLLGRSDARARSTSCCRCRSSWRWCWSPRAWCRPSPPTPRRRVSLEYDSRPTSGSRLDEGQPDQVELTEQTLALGPAASQIAIKQLGTNGGGFFNVNSAHPFENPTPLSNFLELLAILLIPAALCYTFGEMVGDTRQGWAVLAAMMVDLRAAARGLRRRRAERPLRC